MTKISVILTSYNHEKWIGEAIESILKQTFRDFELIIWDDASTDGSWKIIESYSDPRIRAFRNEHNMCTAYIQKIISDIAVSEFIAIHHSDDLWEADKLEKQVRILDTHPELGAVFTWANTIDDNGKPVTGHYLQRLFAQANKNRHEWLRHFLFRGNALCQPSILIRKSCYRDCGLYRPGMFQLPDFDMWIRLCLKYEIHVIPEPLVRFRWHSDGSNSSAATPAVLTRCAFERHLALENYRRIDKLDDILKMLPEARKYLGPEDSDPGFVLARALLDIVPYGVLRLLAQKMLFELVSDPASAARIKELHDFDHMDFKEITGQGSIFVTQAANNPTATPLAKGIEAFNAEDHSAALEHLARAMAREPDNPLPLVYLAFIAVHQGLIAEARDFIARCEQIAPERQEIKAAFGETLWKAGYPEIAVEYLQAVVSARPDMLAAYPLLAQSLNASGRYEEAVSILESVAVIPSDAQADIQNALLQILAEHGDWARLANWHPRRYSRDAGYCPVCGSVDVRGDSRK